MSDNINWDDPAARASLIERIGPKAYEAAREAARKAGVVATVNGYAIRPVMTAFGRLFAVDGTRNAYRTQAQAEAYAASLE